MSEEGLEASGWNLRAIKLPSNSHYNIWNYFLTLGYAYSFFDSFLKTGICALFFQRFQWSFLFHLKGQLYCGHFVGKKLVFVTLIMDSDPYPKRAELELPLNNTRGLLIWWWNGFSFCFLMNDPLWGEILEICGPNRICRSCPFQETDRSPYLNLHNILDEWQACSWTFFLQWFIYKS